MLPVAQPTPRPRPDRVTLVAFAVAASLAAGTAVMLVLPDISGHIVAPGLDLVLDTVATVVTATVTVLTWSRYTEYRDPVDHAASAAFLTLAIVNGVAVLVSVTGFPDAAEGPVHVGQDQAYVFAAGRLLAAGLLVFGGAASLRARTPRYPGPLLLVPAVVVFGVIAVIEAFSGRLPQLVVLAPGGTADAAGAMMTTPFGVLVQLGGAALTMAAAFVWYRLWRQGQSMSRAYLTLGLIIASFAQLHTIAYPSLHPLEVSSGDVLWLVFGAILVLAIQAESRTTLVELRTANTALEELRDVEVERAGLEERARLARELHDGLAQDLWLAKLKAGRLSAMPHLDAESRELSAELAGAIDSGLAEARQAVMALRLGTGGTHAQLCEMMHRFMDDFADRFGLRTEYECDHSTPRLSHRTEVELLRIAQEALNNVHRHADATIVRVRFQTRDGIVSLSVGDNGKGFDPEALVDGGYGIMGMRERAGLINGRLTIDSRPLDGTRVIVQVPVESAPVPDRVRA